MTLFIFSLVLALGLTLESVNIERIFTFNGVSFTLLRSKVISPTNKIRMPEFGISMDVMVPTLTIGVYYEHSTLDDCILIRLRIDAEKVGSSKMKEQMMKLLKIEEGSNEGGCGSFYPGELTIYTNTLRDTILGELGSFIAGESVMFTLCKGERTLTTFTLKRETHKVGHVKLSNKFYCEIKKKLSA